MLAIDATLFCGILVGESEVIPDFATFIDHPGFVAVFRQDVGVYA